MKTNELTKRQREILDFIKNEICSKGLPPSVREICSATGLKSTASVHDYLDILEKKGFIKKASSKSRHIELIESEENNEGNKIIKIPIPEDILSLSNNPEDIKISGYITVSENLYDGIAGTYVYKNNIDLSNPNNIEIYFIKPQKEYLSGDKVLLSENNSIFVGSYIKESDDRVKIKLNDGQIYFLSPEKNRILGKIIGVFYTL